MQNITAHSEHRRELNTLAWLVFAGVLLTLTALFFFLQNRQHIQKMLSQARAPKMTRTP
jgi:type VI protein secretion system component VasF